MGSNAENVFVDSEKEIEIFYYKRNNFNLDTFLKESNIDKIKYQCFGFFFSSSKDFNVNEFDATTEALESLLKANIAIKPTFCKHGIAIYTCRNNFVICGMCNDELEPLCVLSPRTCSISWGDLKLIGMAEIEKAENRLYYGYAKEFNQIFVKVPKNERKRVLLSEGATIAESILWKQS